MDNKNFPPTIITGLFNKFRPHSSEVFSGYRREINRGNSNGEFSLRLYEGDNHIAQVYTSILLAEDLSELRQTVSGDTYIIAGSVEKPHRGRGLGLSLYIEALKEIAKHSVIFNELVVDESGGWVMKRLSVITEEMTSSGFEAVESWRGEYRDMPAALISYSKK